MPLSPRIRKYGIPPGDHGAFRSEMSGEMTTSTRLVEDLDRALQQSPHADLGSDADGGRESIFLCHHFQYGAFIIYLLYLHYL